jgi:hypothetical protein
MCLSQSPSPCQSQAHAGAQAHVGAQGQGHAGAQAQANGKVLALYYILHRAVVIEGSALPADIYQTKNTYIYIYIYINITTPPLKLFHREAPHDMSSMPAPSDCTTYHNNMHHLPHHTPILMQDTTPHTTHHVAQWDSICCTNN